MIWLFCKKKKQNKTQALNLCFPAQKKASSSVFMEWKRLKRKEEKEEERGEASGARHKRKRERWPRLCPSPPLKTHTGRLVGRTEPRVKGERKGLFCAFHPCGAQRRRRTSIQPHEHAYTCTLHTHTAWRWLWPLSLCSANQKTALNPRCVSQRRGAAAETLAGRSRRRICSSQLYKD